MLTAAQAALFAGFLLAASVSDLRRREIPDRLCALLALTGLLCFSPVKLCGILAALPLLSAAIIKEGSIGGGDIKLTAAAGIVLGFRGGIFGLAVGLATALLFAGTAGLVQKLKGRGERIKSLPLAPFLSLGFLAAYALSKI
jgi:leader peptidase (prepilin peptidase)/N-methyltransferase